MIEGWEEEGKGKGERKATWERGGALLSEGRNGGKKGHGYGERGGSRIRVALWGERV